MSDATLIVPTLAETALTGFIGAIEKTIAGACWRLELRRGRPELFLRDGRPADPPIRVVKILRGFTTAFQGV